MAQLYIQNTSGSFELAANMAQVEKGYAKLLKVNKAMAGVNLARNQDKIELSFYDRKGAVTPLTIASTHKLYKLADKIIKLAYNSAVAPVPVKLKREAEEETPEPVKEKEKTVLPRIRSASEFALPAILQPLPVISVVKPTPVKTDAPVESDSESSETEAATAAATTDQQVWPIVAARTLPQRKDKAPKKPKKGPSPGGVPTRKTDSWKEQWAKVIKELTLRTAIQENPITAQPGSIGTLREAQNRLVAYPTETAERIAAPSQMSTLVRLPDAGAQRAAEDAEWAGAAPFLEDIDAYGMPKIYEEGIRIAPEPDSGKEWPGLVVASQRLKSYINGDLVIEPIDPKRQWKLVVEELQKKLTPKPAEEYYTESQDAFEQPASQADQPMPSDSDAAQPDGDYSKYLLATSLPAPSANPVAGLRGLASQSKSLASVAKTAASNIPAQEKRETLPPFDVLNVSVVKALEEEVQLILSAPPKQKRRRFTAMARRSQSVREAAARTSGVVAKAIPSSSTNAMTRAALGSIAYQALRKIP